MADRMLLITWTEAVRGREERALEVFNEAMGLLGRLQQEGKLDSFDVGLMAPNTSLSGFIVTRGSAAQISALRENPEFIKNTIDAQLNVDGITHLEGFTNEGIAAQMSLYQEAISALPTTA